MRKKREGIKLNVKPEWAAHRAIALSGEDIKRRAEIEERVFRNKLKALSKGYFVIRVTRNEDKSLKVEELPVYSNEFSTELLKHLLALSSSVLGVIIGAFGETENSSIVIAFDGSDEISPLIRTTELVDIRGSAIICLMSEVNTFHPFTESPFKDKQLEDLLVIE